MPETDPSPTRVVADADVLAADLLIDGPSRAALDHLRSHSWTTLVASETLLDEAEAVIATLADATLAADWRAKIEQLVESVEHPDGDQPALAAAYRGGAMHLLTFDERLRTAEAGAALSGRFPVSIRHPKAFATLFTPESLYAAVADDSYPGPDRDPRA
ncbi:PIN domain-containing protein [Haloferax mucosum]|nr:PIN domain-containing protein [Haloferax mucosum]